MPPAKKHKKILQIRPSTPTATRQSPPSTDGALRVLHDPHPWALTATTAPRRADKVGMSHAAAPCCAARPCQLYNAATALCVLVAATLIAERGEGCCSARTWAEFSAQSSADGHASKTTRLDAQHSATRRCGRPIYLPEEARKTAGFR
jgi:hypothetical protein